MTRQCWLQQTLNTTLLFLSDSWAWPSIGYQQNGAARHWLSCLVCQSFALTNSSTKSTESWLARPYTLIINHNLIFDLLHYRWLFSPGTSRHRWRHLHYHPRANSRNQSCLTNSPSWFLYTRTCSWKIAAFIRTRKCCKTNCCYIFLDYLNSIQIQYTRLGYLPSKYKKRMYTQSTVFLLLFESDNLPVLLGKKNVKKLTRLKFYKMIKMSIKLEQLIFMS